jgi:hypothetical protein
MNRPDDIRRHTTTKQADYFDHNRMTTPLGATTSERMYAADVTVP